MVSPVVVIGGGLAGAAVATRLARTGQAVTVIEREAGPHEKVCGEFLSVEGCQDLAGLGLPPEHLGAVAIDRVRVLHRRHAVEAKLPFVARGLSRAIMDEALLDMARKAGAEVLRGVRVTGLQGTRVLTSAGEYEASHVMLATGKHDLRAMPRAAPATRDGYVGFKMHWRLSPRALDALGSAIELVLFGQGYAGLQRVGTREANLCLVVRRQHFAELGGTWDALLARLMDEPGLASRLGDAQPLMARPLAIANLPYGHMHRPSGDEGAVWRLGDQAAMTASLSGDGMAVALRSATLAADLFTRGATTAQFHRLLAAQVGPQVRRAMRLQRLSEHPLALALGMQAARACPRLLTLGARATRLPAYEATKA
ncbi:flavin-dependent dehydrogenase [Novosphingobium chloroacetimidivorans]|uniref:Flavin-dependent dehydrogenase n=1 Tax=Novosphingobium chloroacetimidivorans TaxID=1428314 RepID=A0A7W7K9M9_9SPHN|nr:NAD-binding protein [Novosphingobium chloroacetimidivorans]MBB4858496.1 flavin-dependent dehydrogenase [Novosphingobium chloroacetimidivorans]